MSYLFEVYLTSQGGGDFPCGCVVAIWLEITVCVSMYVLRMCVFRWYTCAEVDEMSNYFESTPL